MLMLSAIRLVTVLLCCGLCATIKVPVSWEDVSEEPLSSTGLSNIDINSRDSIESSDDFESPNKEVTEEWTPESHKEQDESVEVDSGKDAFQEWAPEQYKSRDERLKYFEERRPQTEEPKTNPVPIEYFENPTNKPQFAVNIADNSRDNGLKGFEERRPQTEEPKINPVPIEYFENPSNKPQLAVNIADKSRDDRLKGFQGGRPQTEQPKINPVPIEYFEYPSKKPQFAVDVATFHGVPVPHQQYRAYPVHPHTGQAAPHLGQHYIKQPFFSPFQSFMNSHEGLTRHLGPVTSNYEVFHPYKAEEPGLKTLYKDPHLEKVRLDVENNKKRLQSYENEAGKANIEKGDYKKNPKQTDEELFGQSYKPTSFEEYNSEKRPHYYKPPPKQHLPHDYLNKKLKYPLKQNNHIKIRPVHYQPLRNHLKRLRHQQGMRYGDERNEYPQAKPRHKQHFAEPPEGYDIYEDGKKQFDNYSHDVDAALNTYSNDYGTPTYEGDDTSDHIKNQKYESEPKDEEEFVPIKMYAQVRKTESVKHLPKEAAFDDAETHDEILNAPRLREAVKSTKAHTIYSEEGYEDKAYDHEGQQKHASNHEGHGGYLKENENSGGRYKIPFVAHDFEEGDGVAAGNSYSHKEKYKNDDGHAQEQDDSEISSAVDDENDENDYDLHGAGSVNLHANHREEDNIPKTLLSLSKDSERTTILDENDGTSIKTETEHMTATNNKNQGMNSNQKQRRSKGEISSNEDDKISVNSTQFKELKRRKRNVNFEVPKFSLENTYLTESEIIQLSKKQLGPAEDMVKNKYPYYFIKNINTNSPLRYAENLKNVPLKSKGGTEFYDSRAGIECPDVEPEVDPIPEKLNNSPNEEINEEDEAEDDGLTNEDENTEKVRRKRQADYKTLENSPRLRGLGDKIDCFKVKYFGDNPLDSPFFVEDVISDPEPLIEPVSDVFTISQPASKPIAESSEINEIIHKEHIGIPYNQHGNSNTFEDTEILTSPENQTNQNMFTVTDSSSKDDIGNRETDVYLDIIHNIRSYLQEPEKQNKNIVPLLLSSSLKSDHPQNQENKQFEVYLNKEDITSRPPYLRVKRSSQFVYEPYKVIRENQDHDSKKTTTSGNISPLIKQLQASKLVDHTIRSKDLESKQQWKVQPVKRNAKERSYKNIQREDRAKQNSQENDSNDFVDVSVDRRRGEPRYELNKSNHKLEYTPITNSRSMSLEEYKSRVNRNEKDIPEDGKDKNDNLPTSEDENTTLSPNNRPNRGPRPYFDVSAYIPKVRRPIKEKRVIALESIQQPIKRKLNHSSNIKTSREPEALPRTTKTSTQTEIDEQIDDSEYVEYEDEPEVTTTTRKPLKIRRKIKIRTTTTPIPTKLQDYDYAEEEDITTTNKPRIKSVRKLRKPLNENANKSIIAVNTPKQTNPNTARNINKNLKTIPKILEKSVKTQKSTIVTDSKSYGEDGNDDMQKDQIDAMIGGQQNMEEFMGDYDEPRSNEKSTEVEDLVRSQHEESESDENDGQETEEEDVTEQPRHINKDYDNEDNNHGSNYEEEEEEEESLDAVQPKEGINTNLPVVRKIINKNNKNPNGESTGQSSQYRQSINEEETVRKGPGNSEPLQMYQDKSLAKDVNRLIEKNENFDHHSDVEVFKEDIRTKPGPRHGGNYRSAKIVEDLDEREEETPPRPMHGGNLKAAGPGDRGADRGGRRLPASRSAALLNTLAQAAPMLTTTPKYILDPSKRKYYYVDS